MAAGQLVLTKSCQFVDHILDQFFDTKEIYFLAVAT